MSETLITILATAALNGAVTWGIVKTQMAWMRRDIDDIKREHGARLQWLERREAGA